MPNTEANTYNVKMTTPGLYTFTGEVLDDQGIFYQDSVTVLAVDRVELDALLQAKWQGMKARLTEQDAEGALDYFFELSQEKYQILFADVAPQLPQIALDMQAIELIYAYETRAKFRIKRDRMYEGNVTTFTFYIYFIKDEDGLWKIEKF